MKQRKWLFFLPQNYEPSKILHVDNASAKKNLNQKTPRNNDKLEPIKDVFEVWNQ